MTVTGMARLEACVAKHKDAEAALTAWLQVVEAAHWRTPVEATETWGTLDPAVKVASGRKVAVFNIKGNKYRLVAGIDYRREVLTVLRVMTHAEYSRNKWKDSL